MPVLDSGIQIAKPRRFNLDGVRLDLRKLFVKLVDAIGHGVVASTGKIESIPNVISSLVGTIEAFDNDTPLETVGWNLIYRSLVAAVAELVLDAAIVHSPDSPAIRVLGEQCDVFVQEAEVDLTSDFLASPGSLPILQPIKAHLVRWGRAFGLSDAEAQRFAARLPIYFIAALNDEWRRKAKEYQPLINALQSPFAAATQREREWEYYRSWLQKQVALPIFGEVFSLADVYVPLRAYYSEELDHQATQTVLFDERGSPRSELTGSQSPKNIVVDLHEEITSWLRTTTSKDAIRIISGGPGSGKSSFVKKLASDLSDGVIARPIYIPLQRFALATDLREAVGRFVSDAGFFKTNPLTDDADSSQPYLLLMDGLDELTKPGEQADEISRDFLIELQRTIYLLNTHRLEVLAIVTGRTVAIQKSRSAIRQSGRQELVVMKYVYNERERSLFSDPDERLNEDQRRQWWTKYAAAKGLDQQVPKRLLDDELVELSAEPLLNYLLVLSGFHKDSAESEPLNRNAVYRRLLTGVHRRQYESGRFKATQALSDDEFSQVMEIIAVAAWYGDGRTATVDEIREKCSTKKLRGILEAFLSKGTGGINRLIAAFYFQAAEHAKRDDAFEFTHKSFGEYLTARRIVRALDRISRDLLEDQSEKEAPFDEASALAAWYGLCGRAPIDEDLARFVFDEIRMEEWDTRRKDWRAALERLLNYEITHGMVISGKTDRLQLILQEARNSEEALWCVAGACTLCTSEGINIRWPHDLAAGNLFHRIRSQRWPPDASVFVRSLAYLNLDNQNLVIQDLFEAQLRGASLVKAKLIKAELGESDLTQTNFSQAHIFRADFSNANCSEANFSGCEAHHVIFQHGYCVSTRWEGSRLTEAIFTNGQLDQALFVKADLQKASLNECSFVGATFASADLTNADCQASNFAEANFEGANLKAVNFRGANLAGAKFAGAVLAGANFRDAFIDGADFSKADISDVDLDCVARSGEFSAPTSGPLLRSRRDRVRQNPARTNQKRL
jgi:uncharacterized protein YjbI with pentapeptide repeats